MKKIFYIQLFFLSILFIINSCASNKNTTTGNNNLHKTNDKSQMVATSDEPKPQPQNIEDILKKVKYFAEKMAEIYCETKEVNQKYIESGGNKDVLNHLRKLEQKFRDYEKQTNSYFTTDLQKKEFNRIYYELINKCN